MFANVIVSLSNIIGFYCIIIYKLNGLKKLLVVMPVFASIIYHLSETKHNLPGIYPLNKYSNILLNIDRFFAVISFIVTLYNIIKLPLYKQIKYLTIGIMALLCLIISERDVIYKNLNIYSDFTINQYEFILFHSIWHFMAFTLLAKIIK